MELRQKEGSPEEGEIDYIFMDRWGGWGWNGSIKKREGRKREVMWGGTAKTNGHLRGLMETRYSRSFLDIYIYERNLNGFTK